MRALFIKQHLIVLSLHKFLDYTALSVYETAYYKKICAS